MCPTKLPTRFQTSGPLFSANRMPFRVGVRFNDNEGDVAIAAANMDNAENEQSVIPGGIVGFRLAFEQMTMCT